MISNNFIVSNDFLIQDNLTAYMLYFDYFLSQGLPLTKWCKRKYTRRVTYLLIRLGVILMYVSHIYRLRYKMTKLDDNALVIFKGPGAWSSTIKLISRNDNLLIRKKVFNSKIFLKEKKFYQTYKQTTSSICLPKHTFKKNNIIEVEFVKAKTFQRLIVEGSFTLKDSLKHFRVIKNELKLFYKNNSTLIHGDMGLANIFIKNKRYYLIDYTDSHIGDYHYDLYVLLFCLLQYHNQVDKNKQPIANLLGVSDQRVKSLSLQLSKYNKKRFPHWYSN